MTQWFQVFLPDGKYIGVSDNNDGEMRMEQLYNEYGNCKVAVFDRDDIFGHGYDGATPLSVTTIEELYS